MSNSKHGMMFTIRETIGMTAYNPGAMSKMSLGNFFANMVECDSADGSGCGTIWVEFDGHAGEFCPGCGRRSKWGNIIVNSENCPDVSGLREKGIMVVWDEHQTG